MIRLLSSVLGLLPSVAGFFSSVAGNLITRQPVFDIAGDAIHSAPAEAAE